LARHARWKPFGLAIALAIPSPAHAIPTMQPRLRDQEVRVGLQGNAYLTPSLEPTSDSGTGNAALTVGVRGVGNRGTVHLGVEAESLLGLARASYHYLDVGELYLGFEKREAPNHFFAYGGRKRFEWNALDSYWSLGLYEPRFRWDYLNERENGLFGFFPGFRGELVEVTAFVSPIVVPEQGAPFNITGGNCHSSSPWFSCPASTISIFNQPTGVNFSLDVPPVKDLVLHEGHGATVRVGREKGPFARLSYAHKPINQFVLSFEGRLDLATSSVPAVIRPRILYHDLYGADVGFLGARNSFTATALYEHPIRDATPASWNTQELSNATIFGATFVSHPFARLKFTRFEASYLHREGGIAPDQGPFVSASTSYFEPRYAFQNAFSVAAFTPGKDEWARRFLASLKFIVDTANTGNLLVFDAFYSPFGRLYLNLGCDLIGSNSPTPIDFLSRYQRNDRVRGAVAYSF
jgi:hypothetical protein